MGRTFALEMGSVIPSSDQRLGKYTPCADVSFQFKCLLILGSIGGGYGVDAINGASDFVAQYTTRQEYRFSERPLVQGAENSISVDEGESMPAHLWCSASAKYLSVLRNRMVSPGFLGAVKDIQSSLETLHDRVRRGDDVPIRELRHSLRRAASLLCSSNDGQPSIVFHLVDIPFQIFSRDSINLGISLWLGVIHENPYTESRILTEVAEAWERTINRKLGMFDPEFE